MSDRIYNRYALSWHDADEDAYIPLQEGRFSTEQRTSFTMRTYTCQTVKPVLPCIAITERHKKVLKQAADNEVSVKDREGCLWVGTWIL